MWPGSRRRTCAGETMSVCPGSRKRRGGRTSEHTSAGKSPRRCERSRHTRHVDEELPRHAGRGEGLVHEEVPQLLILLFPSEINGRTNVAEHINKLGERSPWRAHAREDKYALAHEVVPLADGKRIPQVVVA